VTRYRWLVLAAGTAAQTSFSAVIVGLPVLAPALRDAHSLSLVQVGFVLDALWIGTLLTLLPWASGSCSPPGSCCAPSRSSRPGTPAPSAR
jgi:hypothetical protein